MDRTKVSGTFDVGSIPAGASSKSCLQKQDFLFCLLPFSLQKKQCVQHCFFSTPSRARTADKLIKSQLLYQLS